MYKRVAVVLFRASMVLILMLCMIVNIYRSKTYSKSDANINSVMDDITRAEVLTVAKSFIKFDASLNTSDAISRIEESKKYLTNSCYEDLYLNNGRFMSLPDMADVPDIRFSNNVVEFKDGKYCIMLLWTETYDSRVYTYTGIAEVNEDKLIDYFRKIPHLK